MSEENSPSEASKQGTNSYFDTAFHFDPGQRHLARFSYHLACTGPFAFLVMALMYPQSHAPVLLPLQALWWGLCLCSPCGAALGATALLLFRRQTLGYRNLRIDQAGAGTVVGVLGSLCLLIGTPLLDNLRIDGHFGHRVACISNVQQLNMGFLMYVQDYDDRYPLSQT